MYYNTSAMQDHLKRKHKIKVETIPRSSDPERFKCSHCLKVFKKSRALKDHINTHTGTYVLKKYAFKDWNQSVFSLLNSIYFEFSISTCLEYRAIFRAGVIPFFSNPKFCSHS